MQQAYFNLGNTRLNLDDKKGACENWKKSIPTWSGLCTEENRSSLSETNLECGLSCILNNEEDEVKDFIVSWQNLGELLEMDRIYE